MIGDGFEKTNICRVAYAIANRMKREHATRFCIGYDKRFLSREAAMWFSEVLAADEIHVDFINLSAPTPQIMFTVKAKQYPYGAAVTASHNAAIYNGIKLFISDGYDAPQDITDTIEKEANHIDTDQIPFIEFDRAVQQRIITFIDPRDEYFDSILEKVDIKAIREYRPRIVVDPMYGTGLTGLLTILYTARCDINMIHVVHDAFFGGNIPAPSPDTLFDLQKNVLAHNAQIGIGMDGDADRLGIIDEKGRYVSANEIISLLYFYLLEKKHWRGDVVRNHCTTHLLDRIAAFYGYKCWEVPVGFKYISSSMNEHDAIIGGESSGGLTVRGHIHGKDGLYAAALLVEMISTNQKSLSVLISEMYQRFGSTYVKESDWPLTEQLKNKINNMIEKRMPLPDLGQPILKMDYLDGCKAYFPNGWLVIRLSGTEPRVRIFSEMETKEQADNVVTRVAKEFNLN